MVLRSIIGVVTRTRSSAGRGRFEGFERRVGKPADFLPSRTADPGCVIGVLAVDGVTRERSAEAPECRELIVRYPRVLRSFGKEGLEVVVVD